MICTCPYCKLDFVTGNEMIILEALEKNSGITLAELERETKIPRATITYYLNKKLKKLIIREKRSGERGRPSKIRLI